jgi:hypothetical protein
MRRIAFLLAAVLTADDNGALADTGPCHLFEFEHAKYAIARLIFMRMRLGSVGSD